ncbi:MAG: hypothetical protein GX985_06720 [Gallicola sp.]|nr:hypothetical protein [Gallicola sp.]
MSGYVVFHMNKAKGNDSRMTAHIERTVQPKNVDPERTHLNRELIEFPEGVTNRTQAIQHRIETAGIKRKITKDQVRVIRVNLSGTHEDMKRIVAEGRIDEWCKDNVDYLKKQFGEKNVVSAVLHMDEKTPHIHASIVPIVIGKRRKAKEASRKNNVARLCADDIMTRSKMEGYQDSYALAMAKYGLQRGIRGSGARHVTTAEYYRDIFEQAASVKIERDLLLQQNEEKQQAIIELQQKEQEEAQRLATLRQAIIQKESELEKKEKQLREVKNEVVQVGFEKTAKEAGKGILEGVGRLMGNPKVKKLEAEVEVLNADIVNLENQKEQSEKEAKIMISQKEKEIAEKDKLINRQQSRLNKLFDGIPLFKEYDLIVRLCETIKLPFEIIKQIFAGEKVPFSGELYSPEHKQHFKAEGVVFSIGSSKENKPLLAINGSYFADWFREQKSKLLEKLGIKPNEPKRQQRMGR